MGDLPSSHSSRTAHLVAPEDSPFRDQRREAVAAPPCLCLEGFPAPAARGASVPGTKSHLQLLGRLPAWPPSPRPGFCPPMPLGGDLYVQSPACPLAPLAVPVPVLLGFGLPLHWAFSLLLFNPASAPKASPGISAPSSPACACPLPGLDLCV